MGYTTDFQGRFDLDRPLTEAQADYLALFAQTRRMRRIPLLLTDAPDPRRLAVGLPLGEEGEYFTGGIGDHGQDEDEVDSSVLDYDEPPWTQPSLWCHWVPTQDRCAICWDGIEKFYCYDAWLHYLIRHFLKPWGYVLSGQVAYQGQDMDDMGLLAVEYNQVIGYDPLLGDGSEHAEG
ncbi:MAG: hypothetical protein JO250_17450 [Armatimonadetes bacterium]|nr:hypothetical protein [Armatimonadota bacterium]